MELEPWTGDKAPDFTAQCVRCGKFTLSEKVRTSPILLYFYPANYGMACMYYIQRMNEYHDDIKKLGIQMFHVNPDTAENHEKWMERMDSKYDHIADAGQNVSRMFGMIVGPSDRGDPLTNRGFVLIDKNMIIRYVWRASMPPETPELGELIAKLRNALKGR